MNRFELNWWCQVRSGTQSAVVWAACAGGFALSANSALAQAVPDADGDGLVAAQERILGTSPNAVDTDGDGVSDLEELARHSSPVCATCVPDSGKAFSIGMTVHAEADGLHALTCVYMSDTNLRAKELKFGFLGGDRFGFVSNEYVAANSTVSYYPSVTVTGCVALIDTRVDPNWVLASGEFEVFAKGSDSSGASGYDVLHLLNIAGVVVYAMAMPQPLVATVVSYGGALEGRGTIYVPLLPAPIAPGGSGSSGGSEGSGGSSAAATVAATWSAGEVCFQRASFVGVNGPSVMNEIIAAECLSGWDGFCPPSCTSTVGSTFKTVDPLVLLGG